jgi:excinuclease ABC subunit A
LEVFQSLISHGHSIIVVEHNIEVIKNADWIVELGLDSGERGGELVFEGTPEQLLLRNDLHTGVALQKSGIKN